MEISFRSEQEIEAKLGDGQTIHSGPSFARLWHYHRAGNILQHNLFTSFDICCHWQNFLIFFLHVLMRLCGDLYHIGETKSCEIFDYRRSGFNCEYLLIANCDYFLHSQLIDAQT